jgi:pyridoxine 5-phosphate synthase
MVAIAGSVRPDQATLVPEKREEITTEGGLDVVGNRQRIESAARPLADAGIEVSLFIDPEIAQVEASREVGADAVELHTGRYADAASSAAVDREFNALLDAGKRARELGLTLHLGHGLNYRNTQRVLAIPEVSELNIGHSIVSRAIFVGLREAVREMKRIIELGARG